MPVLSFGKHAGMDLCDVPGDYLEWLIASRKADLATYTGELERRRRVEEASLSDVEKLVVAGYRALAKTIHPDAGGSSEEFQALQAAYEQLKMILKEVKALGV